MELKLYCEIGLKLSVGETTVRMCHGAQIVQPNGNELKQRKGLTLIFFATVDRLNAFRTQLSARPAKGLEFTHAQYTNPVEKPT